MKYLNFLREIQLNHPLVQMLLQLLCHPVLWRKNGRGRLETPGMRIVVTYLSYLRQYDFYALSTHAMNERTSWVTRHNKFVVRKRTQLVLGRTQNITNRESWFILKESNPYLWKQSIPDQEPLNLPQNGYKIIDSRFLRVKNSPALHPTRLTRCRISRKSDVLELFPKRVKRCSCLLINHTSHKTRSSDPASAKRFLVLFLA